MSLRDDLLALRADTRVVSTRAGDVLVQGMSLDLKDRVQGAALDGVPYRRLMLLHCVLDPETRKPVFSADDLDALGGLPLDLEVLVDVATELSALTIEDIEELEGNSGGTPSESSG